MNAIDQMPFLDMYEGNWPHPKEEEAPLTKEDISHTYLVLHHSFLAEEPDYLRKVISVEVLFQESAEHDPPTSNDALKGTNHSPARNQVSLARSLSVDSLPTSGLGSDARSATFSSHKISCIRSSLRIPMPAARSHISSSHPSPPGTILRENYGSGHESRISDMKSENWKSLDVQHHHTRTDGKHKEPQSHIGVPKWVIPIAITVGISLMVGYFFLRRRTK